MPSPDELSCAGKVPHPSRKIATENLHRVRRGLDTAGKDRKERGKLVVYRCRACAMWHVGNNDVVETRARRLSCRRVKRPPEIEEAA